MILQVGQVMNYAELQMPWRHHIVITIQKELD